MTTLELFQSVQNSPLALALGQAPVEYGIGAQLLHISGLILVLTPTLLVSLRILGCGLLHFSAEHLEKASRMYVFAGLLMLFFSGLFMLLPSASLYEPNPAFNLKIKLLLLALLAHYALLARIARDTWAARWHAKIIALSLLALWFSVGMAGRAIGFMAA